MSDQKQSIIDYRFLRARKAYLGLINDNLIEACGSSSKTVSDFFSGDETQKLQTITRHAAALGLRVKVTFEIIEEAPAK